MPSSSFPDAQLAHFLRCVPNPGVLARLQERVVVWQDGAWREGAAPTRRLTWRPTHRRNEVAAVVYLESSDAEHRLTRDILNSSQPSRYGGGRLGKCYDSGWLQEENEACNRS